MGVRWTVPWAWRASGGETLHLFRCGKPTCFPALSFLLPFFLTQRTVSSTNLAGWPRSPAPPTCAIAAVPFLCALLALGVVTCHTCVRLSDLSAWLMPSQGLCPWLPVASWAHCSPALCPPPPAVVALLRVGVRVGLLPRGPVWKGLLERC